MVMPALRRADGYSIGSGLGEPPTGPVDIESIVPSNTDIGADGVRVTVNNDGTVDIVAGPLSIPRAPDGKFDANLAEQMASGDLAKLSADLIDGIKADVQSRITLVEKYNKGIDLLALTVEEDGTGRQRKRTSKVRHPVMLDAVIKFWAAAAAELLPAAGPCKVKDDAESDEHRDQLAAQFERDMNHYLTVAAPEYYPDTSQMLVLLGFGGTTYKKIYQCPLRERPVSEAVRLPDLIINEQATDLDNAIRVTHQISMAPVQVKRLQIGGFWRNADLGPPDLEQDTTKAKEQSIHGLAPTQTYRPDDRDRIVWECYTDLDLSQYGMAEPTAPKRDDVQLPLPYRVTLDKSSMQVLEVRRNWREGDPKFRARRRFVKWMMVPGLGFLGLGFLHLLGNQTRALTALWRIMIDCGMFGAFPGGVKVKGTRQTTNEIAPGPGEWVEIDTGPIDDIRKALMALPYKDLNAVYIQLAEMISGHAEKLGTSIEFPTGEGRTNIPVGTIMAMIEQQTQVMAAVHKGLHRAQQEELLLLKELFIEDPEALWRCSPDPSRQWSSPDEFKDCRLVPATDPNVPSQIHRIMVATALVTLAQNNPDIYDKVAVHKRALREVGIADVDTLVQPPQPMQAGADPDAMAKMSELQLKQMDLGLKGQEQRRKAAASTIEAQQRGREIELKAKELDQTNATKQRVAGEQEQTQRLKLAHDSQNAALDRQQQGQQHREGLVQQHHQSITQLTHQHHQAEADRQQQAHEHMTGLAAEQQRHATDIAHQRDQHSADLAQQQQGDQARLAHEREQKDLDRAAKAAEPKFGGDKF